jgi:hypothetical protein
MDPIQKNINSFLNKGVLYFQDNNLVMQFIPILLLLFHGFYGAEFVALSHTVLGKLFAVVLILYYSKLNYLYGTFACVIAILYYKMTDTALEGFEQIKKAHEAVGSKGPLDKCKNGVLMSKGMPVKTEMIQHIYPEIKFAGDAPCNPCDKTCQFSILDAKREMEEPKNSRDFFSVVHNAIMGDEFATKFEPYKAPIIG